MSEINTEYQKYYNEMDYIVNLTYINLFSLANRSNRKIILKDFDFKNPEHQYLLEICYIARRLDACDDIEIVGNKINIFFKNLKNKKKEMPIKSIKNDEYNFPTVDEILDFMRPVLEEKIPIKNFNYGCILYEYFR